MSDANPGQTATTKRKITMKAVILTTKHRGVFFGFLPADADDTQTTLRLERAKMAIRWGTTGGVLQLAGTGPTEKSKIGTEAPSILLHDITSVIGCSDEAVAKWAQT